MTQRSLTSEKYYTGGPKSIHLTRVLPRPNYLFGLFKMRTPMLKHRSAWAPVYTPRKPCIKTPRGVLKPSPRVPYFRQTIHPSTQGGQEDCSQAPAYSPQRAVETVTSNVDCYNHRQPLCESRQRAQSQTRSTRTRLRQL